MLQEVLQRLHAGEVTRVTHHDTIVMPPPLPRVTKCVYRHLFDDDTPDVCPECKKEWLTYCDENGRIPSCQRYQANLLSDKTRNLAK
jgi:predicted Zn-ribbon and HTH transcriptional regulator